MHDAFEIILCSLVNLSSLQPNTTVISGLTAGALIRTLFAPASKCLAAPSLLTKNPVDSTAISMLLLLCGKFAGSLSAVIGISFPSITKDFSLASTFPLNLPNTVSYFNT